MFTSQSTKFVALRRDCEEAIKRTYDAVDLGAKIGAQLREEVAKTGERLSTFRSEQNKLEDSLKALRSQKEVFETHLSLLNDREEEEANEMHILVDSPAPVELEGLPQDKEQVRLIVEDHFPVFNDDSDTESGAASVSMTGTNNAKKRRLTKVYKSPKKWRRMVRTHRLQSFFIIN